MSKSQGHVEGAPEVAATGGEAISMTRRNFLRSSLGAAAFMAAPNILTPARAEAKDGETESLTNAERIYGSDRVQTSLAIARAKVEEMYARPDGEITHVWIARKDLFPDAFAVSSTTARGNEVGLGGVVVLNDRSYLEPDVRDFIIDLRNNYSHDELDFTVSLAGGPGALDESIRQYFRDKRYQTARYHGANRAGTAAEIASISASNRIYLASGWNDDHAALIAGAHSMFVEEREGKRNVGNLVYTGRDSSGRAFLPQETLDFINSNSQDIIAVGSEAAEALDRFKSQIKWQESRTFASHIDSDHYRLAIKMAKLGIDRGSIPRDTLTIVRGEGTPVDALAGAPICVDGPIVFTPTNSLHPEIARLIRDYGFIKGRILGGPNAISEHTAAEFDDLLRQQQG